MVYYGFMNGLPRFTVGLLQVFGWFTEGLWMVHHDYGFVDGVYYGFADGFMVGLLRDYGWISMGLRLVYYGYRFMVGLL